MSDLMSPFNQFRRVSDTSLIPPSRPELRPYDAPWYQRLPNAIGDGVDAVRGAFGAEPMGPGGREYTRKLFGTQNPLNVIGQAHEGADTAVLGVRNGDWKQIGLGALEAASAVLPLAAPYRSPTIAAQARQNRLLARRMAEPVEDTTKYSGYGTQSYKHGRQFSIDGSPIEGQGVAKLHLDHIANRAAGPDGPEYNSLATILIGPPGAGKSALSKSLAENTRSAMISADDAKFIMPEMRHKGASFVHEESSDISNELQKEARAQGRNIVLEKLGGDPNSISKLATGLGEQGYGVRIAHVTAPRDVLAARIADRAAKTGRDVPVSALDHALNGIDKTLAMARAHEHIKGIMSIDNGGRVPYIMNAHGDIDGKFVAEAAANRARQLRMGNGSGESFHPEVGAGNYGGPGAKITGLMGELAAPQKDLARGQHPASDGMSELLRSYGIGLLDPAVSQQ